MNKHTSLSRIALLTTVYMWRGYPESQAMAIAVMKQRRYRTVVRRNTITKSTQG